MASYELDHNMPKDETANYRCVQAATIFFDEVSPKAMTRYGRGIVVNIKSYWIDFFGILVTVTSTQGIAPNAEERMKDFEQILAKRQMVYVNNVHEASAMAVDQVRNIEAEIKKILEASP